MAENLSSCPDLSAGQDVVLPVETPIKSTGHLQILYGNLAPEGSVAKITGKEGLKFTGQVSVNAANGTFTASNQWYCYIFRVKKPLTPSSNPMN
jgi:dihydroxyacid dehydratase/phosphogluconate dehydratase